MAKTGGNRPVLRADKRTGVARPPKKQAPTKRSPGKTPRKTKGPVGWFRAIIQFVMGLVWSLIWRGTVVFGLIIGTAVFYFYAQLPPMSELIDGRTRGSVTLLDRNDDVFAWRGEQFDSILSSDQISPHLKNAVVATEDRRFFWHFGVSPRGVAGAVRINLSEGRGPLSGHGGSTLTQQTAKLLCLGVPYDPTSGMTEKQYEDDCRETSKWRKIKEAMYAIAMEVRYTKDEILTIYLNRAYLGASARGFEAASQRYFGVPARALSPAQSAMLAGLLVAPTRYAPTNSLSRAQERAATVVKLMADQGYLTPAERDEAWANPATLSDAAEKRAGGYFADWVMDSGPGFLTSDTTEDVILSTTLDQKLQIAAEQALKTVFETKVRAGSKAEAAIVVMSSDGAVRAMVGGRKNIVSGAFNRATMAKRQTGSAFKPFVYAAALDLGFTPNATVVDAPLTLDIPGSGPWSPQNYDRKFRGRVSLTQALRDSLNVPAVLVSEEVGRDNVQKVAADFGIESDLAAGPALALGASESSLIEMTGAYAGILNGGRSVAPYGLRSLRLQGDDTALMDQEGGFGERVISEEAAQYLVYMMSKVIEEGTGQRAKLGARPAAGKTGTTQAARDAWFIGFTADYVTGVWMGYDDNTPLSGVTGGGLPAEIWHETMVRVHAGLPVSPLPMKLPALTSGTQPEDARTGQTGDRRRPAQTPPDNGSSGTMAERVLLEVLRGLLGGSN
ncbi:MAG: penicillin-binding protein 1A [Paracoccaceae bacterium]|jgi:penicillin-binding protein 1A